MDVPSPRGGTIEALLVKVGDRVSEGSPVIRLRGSDAGAMSEPPSLLPQQEPPPAAQPTPSPAPEAIAPPAAPAGGIPDFSGVHAGPGVRRAARELDVDLNKVKGSGEKGRITKEDLLGFLRGPAPGAGGARSPAAAAFPKSRRRISASSGRSR